MKMMKTFDSASPVQAQLSLLQQAELWVQAVAPLSQVLALVLVLQVWFLAWQVLSSDQVLGYPAGEKYNTAKLNKA